MTRNFVLKMEELKFRLKKKVLEIKVNELRSDVKRLKDIRDGLKVSNSFCMNCMEGNCDVDSDGRCKMVMEYLKHKEGE
jgi:hypothetical protein